MASYILLRIPVFQGSQNPNRKDEELFLEAMYYSGTPLIRSPMGKKKNGCINGVAALPDRVKFYILRAVITKTPYFAFAPLELSFSKLNAFENRLSNCHICILSVTVV